MGDDTLRNGGWHSPRALEPPVSFGGDRVWEGCAAQWYYHDCSSVKILRYLVILKGSRETSWIILEVDSPNCVPLFCCSEFCFAIRPHFQFLTWVLPTSPSVPVGLRSLWHDWGLHSGKRGKGTLSPSYVGLQPVASSGPQVQLAGGDTEVTKIDKIKIAKILWNNPIK